MEGTTSNLLCLFAGVPQGSVLGPLLFLIFINDILDNLECLASLFADDTSIYTTFKAPNNLNVYMLQSDLVKIEIWSKLWKVAFNTEKTEMLIISRTNNKPNIKLYFLGKQIKIVHQHKHLGVILDDTLNWHPQIESITSKTQLSLNIMKHFKYIFSRNTLKVIYIYHVKSIINYGDILLGKLSVYLTNLLETIQYQALCTVTGCVKGTSETKMREELGWNTLVECRQLHLACMIYKMVNNLVPSYLANLLPPFRQPIDFELHNLRPNAHHNPDILTLQLFEGSQFYLKSWLPQAVIYWNTLALEIRESPSLNVFKSRLKVMSYIPKKRYFETGNRKFSTIHCQLRLGTNSLNVSLFNRTLSISPNCSCRTDYENEMHYFLQCPNYHIQRNELLTSIANVYPGNLFVNLSARKKLEVILKGDESMSYSHNCVIIQHVHRYIQSTNRFT